MSTLLLNSLSWSNLWNTSVGVAFLRACLGRTSDSTPSSFMGLSRRPLATQAAPEQGPLQRVPRRHFPQYPTSTISHLIVLVGSFFFLNFLLEQERKNIKEREPLGLDVLPSFTSAGALTLVRVSSAWIYSKLGMLFYLLFYSNYAYKICIACAIVFSTLRPVPGLLRGRKYSRKCIVRYG